MSIGETQTLLLIINEYIVYTFIVSRSSDMNYLILVNKKIHAQKIKKYNFIFAIIFIIILFNIVDNIEQYY